MKIVVLQADQDRSSRSSFEIEIDATAIPGIARSQTKSIRSKTRAALRRAIGERAADLAASVHLRRPSSECNVLAQHMAALVWLLESTFNGYQEEKFIAASIEVSLADSGHVHYRLVSNHPPRQLPLI